MVTSASTVLYIFLKRIKSCYLGITRVWYIDRDTVPNTSSLYFFNTVVLYNTVIHKKVLLLLLLLLVMLHHSWISFS